MARPIDLAAAGRHASSMNRVAAAVLIFAVSVTTAFAQSMRSAPLTPFDPGAAAAPGRAGVTLSLSATLEGDARVLDKGVSWRVYSDPSDGTPARVVAKSDLASPVFALEPGAYVVHVAFGLAGMTRRVVIAQQPLSERIALPAGGLVLRAQIGDAPIASERVRFNVYVPVGSDPEGRLVASNVRQGALLRLPEGQYRVVSTYGDTNAIANADLRVESGKVLDAAIRHRAATVTLKLVLQPGSEAIAGTSFSVLTPGGDTVREAAGAFPSMILAEGEYVVIARHGGKVYTSEVKVRSGYDRDLEVIAR